jgi:hypothetical protein
MIKANEMNHTKEDRELFVENLGWLLSQTRTGVVSAALDSEREIVTVTFDNGYTKKVNVACDSYIAIVQDVAKHIN